MIVSSVAKRVAQCVDSDDERRCVTSESVGRQQPGCRPAILLRVENFEQVESS